MLLLVVHICIIFLLLVFYFKIIIMSIAALLQAAEYLERRERGEFGRVFIRTKELEIHVNMAPIVSSPGNQLILTLL